MDAIIVLAGGITVDGELSAWSKARVETGVRTWTKQRSLTLVMSGRWGFRWPYVPVQTEAAAMRDYAVELGVPRSRIVLEAQSDDTITQAYYTYAKLVQAKGWRSVGIVTSAFHLPRSQFVFETIYGSRCRIRGIAAPNERPDSALVAEEDRLLALTQEWFAPYRAGASTLEETLFAPESVYQFHRRS